MEQISRQGRTTTLIHYVYQTNPERIACMPGMDELHETPYHPNYQRSSSPSAVSCPACKRTKEYQAKAK